VVKIQIANFAEIFIRNGVSHKSGTF